MSASSIKITHEETDLRVGLSDAQSLSNNTIIVVHDLAAHLQLQAQIQRATET